MKRLIFGLAAIVFAAATAAFTMPKSSANSLQDYYFAFDYATYSNPTVGNVEDPAKWVKVNDLNGCSIGSDRACKLRVGEESVEDNHLISTFAIDASESASGIAYVVASDASQIINRANP